MKKIILIDGNAILHRSFYGVPPFRTSSGELVNAIYGFYATLFNIIDMQEPEYLALTFDLPGATFRHKEYKEYKATRKKAPDELYPQLDKIKNIARTCDIPIYEQAGFEADDVLGTLATNITNKNSDIMAYIVTGDMDSFQLITDQINILTPTKGGRIQTILNNVSVFDKYGIQPKQITDLKGLQGDPSDNIKGVAGIGKVTATKLIQEFTTIENIYKNINKIKPSIAKKLINDEESAHFSKYIATIIKNVPISHDLNSCKLCHFNYQNMRDELDQLEFKSLLSRIQKIAKKHSDTLLKVPGQQSLF